MVLLVADINEIKAFISKRGFTEPDLQMEIIDHMACRVEELMTANALLSLNEAIGLAHSEFGIMGFSVFEDAMRAALQKRYWKVFKKQYTANFTWKTLPLMFAFVYLVSIVFQAVNKPHILFPATGMAMIGMMLVNALHNSAKYKPYNKMLTFKIGSFYLIISSVLFQVYNVLLVQLKVYEHISLTLSGTLYASVLLLLMVTFYSINKTQQHAVNSCKELETKYRFMSL